jgi:histidine ammonia-lyase
MCFPASADSIPTGCNIEDHVSKGPIAARRALEAAARVASVLAIELLTAAQALDLRAQKPGRGSARVLALIRGAVPFRPEDAPWGDALERTRALVVAGDVARAAGLARGAASRDPAGDAP